MKINEAWLAAHNSDPDLPARIHAQETSPDPIADWDLSGEPSEFYQETDYIRERRNGNV